MTKYRHILAHGARLLSVLGLITGIAACAPARAASHRAVTGLIPGGMLLPVVDSIHHDVYGFTPHSIRVLDELSGSTRALRTVDRRSQFLFVAIDPGTRRLLAEEMHLDHIYGKDGIRGARETTYADVIDAVSGELLSRLQVGPSYLWHFYEDVGGSATVDTVAHHGVVTDLNGSGVLVDMRTGRALTRFHSGVSNSADLAVNQAYSTAIDPRTHHLFLLVEKTPRGTSTTIHLDSEIVVVDTVTGRIIRTLSSSIEHIPFSEYIFLDTRLHTLILGGSDYIVLFDTRTGNVVRHVYVGVVAQALGVDAVLSHVFTLGSRDGYGLHRLLLIDLRSGKVAQGILYGNRKESHGYSFGTPESAIDSRTSRIFVIAGIDGTMGVFSTVNGRLLRKVPLEHYGNHLRYFMGLTVDESSHRLYIGSIPDMVSIDTRR